MIQFDMIPCRCVAEWCGRTNTDNVSLPQKTENRESSALKYLFADLTQTDKNQLNKPLFAAFIFRANC